MRPLLVPLILALAPQLLTPAPPHPRTHPPAQPPWASRSIPAPQEQESMAAAAEALAARAGLSLLIEGWPARKPYRPTKSGQTLTVGEALTDLARAYDYAWDLSRSGVVLLRRRFSDEGSRPELTEGELRAATREIVARLGRRESFLEGSPLAYDLLRQVAAALPPEAARKLDGAGVPLGDLPPELQRQAVTAGTAHFLGTAAGSWTRLEAQVAELPEAVVELEAGAPPRFGGRRLVLRFPHSRSHATRSPVGLFRTDSRLVLPAGGLPGAAAVAAPQTSLLQARSAREACEVLSRSLGTRVEVAPELLERRLIFFLQPGDAARGLEALAELHGWTRSIRRGEGTGPDTYRLARSRPGAAGSPQALGAALFASLPADVARCMLTPPVRLEGQPAVYVPDVVPEEHPNGILRANLAQRFRLQQNLAWEELQTRLAARDFRDPVPWTALGEEERRLVLYALFARTVGESLEEWLRLRYRPPGYLLDPANARLIRQGDAVGLRGARGGSFLIRQRPLP